MRDYIKVSHFGLAESDAKALKSMFALVPELRESYRLSPLDKSLNASIVIINADNPAAIVRWNKIAPRMRDLAGTLMLGSSVRATNGSIILNRPLKLRKLVDALKAIIQDGSIVGSPGIGDTGISATAKLRILVVDDSYPVRKYMENKLAELTKIPLFLSFAESGQEAMLKVSQEKYDLIFLDVVMPGADGYKVCKAIKNGSKAYVVMLTSKKSPFDKIRGTMSGCNAYLTKPPSDQRLIEEIKLCLQGGSGKQDKSSNSPAQLST